MAGWSDYNLADGEFTNKMLGTTMSALWYAIWERINASGIDTEIVPLYAWYNPADGDIFKADWISDYQDSMSLIIPYFYNPLTLVGGQAPTTWTEETLIDSIGDVSRIDPTNIFVASWANQQYKMINKLQWSHIYTSYNDVMNYSKASTYQTYPQLGVGIGGEYSHFLGILEGIPLAVITYNGLQRGVRYGVSDLGKGSIGGYKGRLNNIVFDGYTNNNGADINIICVVEGWTSSNMFGYADDATFYDFDYGYIDAEGTGIYSSIHTSEQTQLVDGGALNSITFPVGLEWSGWPSQPNYNEIKGFRLLSDTMRGIIYCDNGQFYFKSE